MPKKNKKHIQLYAGMSLYKRDGSRFYWGYLTINKKVFKKSLRTEDRNEAEQLLFKWKSELMSRADSPVGETGNSFSAHAKRLINKEKRLPPRPSGIEQWTDTQRLLHRTHGLIDFFGNRDVDTITVQDIEHFFEQSPPLPLLI